MADVYSVNTKGKKHKKWLKRLFKLLVLLVIIGAIVFAVIFIRNMLKPQTVIKQSTAITSKVTFEEKTTTYDQVNFTIKIPKDWKKIPGPGAPYTTYSWQTSDSGTDGQVLTIYEDKIPLNFAVNRVLIIRSDGDHIAAEGSASDNCSKYTRGAPVSNQHGAPAKWQDVDFLCDQSNKQRDVIGTSSLEGVNTVILHGPTTGAHKYFFSYSSYDAASPDYTPFYNALNSLRMK